MEPLRYCAALVGALTLVVLAGCVDEAARTERTLAEAGRLEADGQLAQAAARYEAVLEGAPDSPEALGALARIRLEQQRWEPARRLASRAAELSPNEPDHHETLGRALVRLERWGEARRALLEALSLDPEREELQRLLGRARLETGDREGAIAAWSRWLELHPDAEQTRLELAELLVTDLEARLPPEDEDESSPSEEQLARLRAAVGKTRQRVRELLGPLSGQRPGAEARAQIERRLQRAVARVRARERLELTHGSVGGAPVGGRATGGGFVLSGHGSGVGGLGGGTLGGSGSGSSGAVGILQALSGTRAAGPVQIDVSTHGYPEARVRQMARARRGALWLCYEMQRRRQQGLQGEVVVEMDIDTSGAVASVSAVDAGLGNAAVPRCLGRVVARWRFPPPTSAAHVVLRLEFAPPTP